MAEPPPESQPHASPSPAARDDPGTREQARTLRHWLWSIALLALLLAAAFKLFDFAWLIARPLALLILAIVLAEALAPIVDWLARRLPRPLVIGLVYLGLFLIIGLIGWIVVPGLVDQAQEIGANAPMMIEEARRWIDRVGVVGSGQIQNFLAARVGQLSGQLVSLPFTIFTSAFDIVAVLFLSVYWLIEAPTIERFALSLCPEPHREGVGAVLREMGRSMGGYIRGTILNGLIIGGLAYIGYLVIGLRYSLILALLAGMLEIVPILGPIIAAIPTVLIALTDSLTKGLIVLAFMIVLHQVEGHIVTPNVMRSQTDVPQLLVLLALLIGGSIGGILGILVAIPLSGALRVLVLHALAPAIRQVLTAVATDDRGRSAAPH